MNCSGLMPTLCLFSEVAYGQYKDKLGAALKSTDERKENLIKSIKIVEINQNLLTEKLNEQKDHLERLEKDRARTDELYGQAEKLLTDEKE